MKIIVDKVPEKPEECYFAEYAGDGFHECKLDREGCLLCYNSECDKLIRVKEESNG